MNALNKRPVAACLLSLSLLFTTGIVKANDNATTGQLRLAAVLNGKPALKSATWRIKCRNDSRRYGKTIKRHAAVVDLEPGDCVVKVLMNGKSRTRYISIERNKKYSVVMSFS